MVVFQKLSFTEAHTPNNDTCHNRGRLGPTKVKVSGYFTNIQVLVEIYERVSNLNQPWTGFQKLDILVQIGFFSQKTIFGIYGEQTP